MNSFKGHFQALRVDNCVLRTIESKRIQEKEKDVSKTITLRLREEVYKTFAEAAHAENRSLSNLIETAALNKIRESQFVDDLELAEIVANEDLMSRIREGSRNAKNRKGRFVDI